MDQSAEVAAVQRLSRDLAKAAENLSRDEARFLVDYYYISQGDRIRADNQKRALTESKEPCAVIGWLSDQTSTIEGSIKRALERYVLANPVGKWSMSVCGVGPVISAGLLAHIDIEKAPTVGHIWRYAGLDPTVTWGKGEKRPWNADLKTLCWKIGESFVKVKGRENGFYGHYFEERKVYRTGKNDAGDYADRALGIAKDRPKHAQVKTYNGTWVRDGVDKEAGMKLSLRPKLPLGHIHAQAKRDAVKLFLSHWHEIAYKEHYGKAPPLPYPIAILGHAHKIDPQT